MLSNLHTLVINWNLRDDTLACLRSLFADGAVPGSVIVVDNGSTDGSPAAITKEFEAAVRLIETGENLGLAGGINAGLPAALEGGASWIFLLNNDTVIEPGFFDRFDRAVQAHPDIAIWGPRIVYYADPQRTWFLAERRIGRTLLGQAAPNVNTAPGAGPEIVRADFISGCAMLVRREVFERIGGFDSSLFLFAEEVDFCLRAGLAGFRLAAAPGAVVRHKVSLSTGRDKKQSRFLRIRNQVRVYRRFASLSGAPFYFVFTFLRSVKFAFFDLLRGDAALAGAALRGWLAGWFSRQVPGRFGLPAEGARPRQ